MPQLVDRRIAGPFRIGDETWTPLPILHGSASILGFRVGGLAYMTDASAIPDATWPLLEGVDTGVRASEARMLLAPVLRQLGERDRRILYRRFFDDAARAGAHTVRAVTSPVNTTSIAFHRAAGFTVSPVEPDYDGPGHDRVCFSRTLPC